MVKKKNNRKNKKKKQQDSQNDIQVTNTSVKNGNANVNAAISAPKNRNPSLRFMVGDDVEFQRDDCVGWHAGTVEELWHRSSKWPDSRPSCPYMIEHKSELPHGKPRKVLIHVDDDFHIRVLHHSQYPPNFVIPDRVLPPEPEDPLRFLYHLTVPENEPMTWRMFEALLQFRGEGKVEEFKTHTNGASTLRVVQGRDAIQNEAIALYMPKDWNEGEVVPSVGHENYKKMPYDKIGAFSTRIRFRRPVEDFSRSMQPRINSIDLVRSILPPKESSIGELKSAVYQQSLQRSQKLLYLADALYYEILGGERDYQRAVRCYRAAALDLAVEDGETKEPCLMRGLPEAMCAYAVLLHGSLEAMVYQAINNLPQIVLGAWAERPGLEVEQILDYLLYCPNTSQLIGNLEMIMGALSCALRFGWTSNLAYQYGRYFDQENRKQAALRAWNDSMNTRNIQYLHDAYTHHQLILHIQDEKKAALLSAERYALPTSDTIALFEPKATDILRGIPTTVYSRTSMFQVDLIVRYFEIKNVPTSPVYVLLACPDIDFMDVLRLPNDLQLFPFSEQAFQWIWLRIAFIIHLGLRTTKSDSYARRIRPTKLKLLDVAGDHHLADYLQCKCLSIPGTKVELLDFDEDKGVGKVLGLHEEDLVCFGTKPRSLQAKLEEEEAARELEFSFWLKIRHKLGTPFQLSRSSDENQLVSNNSQEETKLLKEADAFKTTGNSHFAKGKHTDARRQYLKALSSLRVLRNPPKEAMEMMGAILSNHAICCLEIAKTQNATSGAHTLKEAIVGCNLILEDDNMKVCVILSDDLLKRLRFRRDLDASRRPKYLDESNECSRPGGVRGLLVTSLDVQYNLRLFSGDPATEKTPPKPMQIMLGRQLVQGDGSNHCPVCLDKFSGELTDKYVARLPCAHSHCARCLLEYCGKTVAAKCSICRSEITQEYWEKAIEDIALLSAPALLDKLALLPLEDLASRLDVLRCVLLKKAFDVDLVEGALDEMIGYQIIGVPRQRADLSADQKQQIYLETRKPLELLEEKQEELQEELARTNKKTKQYEGLERELAEISRKLCQASRAAADNIFSKLNSVGFMARMNESDEYQLDFHGMTVKDAKEKLNSLVLPVLPVLKRVVIITGHGKRRENAGALKPALTRWIKSQCGCSFRCEAVQGNIGAIRVLHVSEDLETID